MLETQFSQKVKREVVTHVKLPRPHRHLAAPGLDGSLWKRLGCCLSIRDHFETVCGQPVTLCCERTWKSYSLEDVGLSLAAASPACGDVSAVLSSILSLTPAHVSLVLGRCRSWLLAASPGPGTVDGVRK